MPMKVHMTPVDFPGVYIIQPDSFSDDRGFFTETYHRAQLKEQGLDITFVQDNHSRSKHGVVRGFHYQDAATPQVRLVRCTVGEVYDVIVDLTVGSPTFGKYFGVRLSAENRKQLLIPGPFAHGFMVLSDVAEVQDKVSDHHNPAAEHSLLWNDPDVGVDWPLSDPILSAKDRVAPTLQEYLKAPCFGVGTLA